MRTGKEYLSSLQDGRTVLIDGERVDDVTTHPAFAPVATVIAELYDIAADPANGMQYVAPETGETANLVFGIPRSADDLAARRAAIQ
jgi:4-hydroxyphenylacetate 3-monooxygenase